MPGAARTRLPLVRLVDAICNFDLTHRDDRSAGPSTRTGTCRALLSKSIVHRGHPDARRRPARPDDEREGVSGRLTDIGACVQDWSMAPCPSHGSCAACGEHLVIKGDKQHRERAQQLLTEHEPCSRRRDRRWRKGRLDLGRGPRRLRFTRTARSRMGP